MFAYSSSGTKPLSKTDQLRRDLAKLESGVGKLGHGIGQDALGLLTIFDNVQSLMAELLVEGAVLKSEQALLTTTKAVFRKKARIFLGEIGGRRKLIEARANHDPGPDRWWWFIDSIAAEERKQSRLSLLRFGLIAIAILVILGFIYKVFLEPDPNFVARLKHEEEAQVSLAAGEFEMALFSVNEALELAPEDPDLLTLQGVIYEARGDADASNLSFRNAEELSQNREGFLQIRAEIYLNAGWIETASLDIEELLVINPENPTNHLLQAQVFEARGKFEQAIAAYTRTDELAQEAGEAELAAFARVLMGQLISRMGAGGDGE